MPSLLTLLAVIIISVGIFCFYRRYPERLNELRAFGYLGVFLISLIFNATVILPAGTFVAVSTLGAMLPLPVVVGLVAGVGAAFGEMTGYLAGYSGRHVFERSRTYSRVEDWVRRWGTLTIFFMSVAPIVFDLAGLAAGMLRFPWWKFLLACWLGRTVLYILIALASAWSWRILLEWVGTLSCQ
jgi:membrane protein YqaA with SNARE-associated domain